MKNRRSLLMTTRGEGESMRDAGKNIDQLFIAVFEWTSGDCCAHVTMCVCVCV